MSYGQQQNNALDYGFKQPMDAQMMQSHGFKQPMDARMMQSQTQSITMLQTQSNMYMPQMTNTPQMSSGVLQPQMNSGMLQPQLNSGMLQPSQTSNMFDNAGQNTSSLSNKDLNHLLL